MKFLTLIVETTKKWYFISNKQSSRSCVEDCSQQKTAKTVHRLKYSLHWSRIYTGFDASKFL